MILLVEDHDLYREVVRAALARYLPGIEMLEAESMRTALAVLQRSHVHVIIIDMTLPDGSAVDLVKHAHGFIERGMRVIVNSSHDSTEMLPLLTREDVHGYVSKDQGLKALAQAIRAVCGDFEGENGVAAGSTTASGTLSESPTSRSILATVSA